MVEEVADLSCAGAAALAMIASENNFAKQSRSAQCEHDDNNLERLIALCLLERERGAWIVV